MAHMFFMHSMLSMSHVTLPPFVLPPNALVSTSELQPVYLTPGAALATAVYLQQQPNQPGLPTRALYNQVLASG